MFIPESGPCFTLRRALALVVIYGSLLGLVLLMNG